jgi:hypothetical protein
MHPGTTERRGSCQKDRGPLRGFPRIRSIDLALAFSGVSTGSGSLGSNPDPSATRALSTAAGRVAGRLGSGSGFPVLVLVPENELSESIDQMDWEIRRRSQPL